MPRYQVTLEYWAENDEQAVDSVIACKGAIDGVTLPLPEYVKEDGIAAGEVAVINGPMSVSGLDKKEWERLLQSVASECDLLVTHRRK